MIAGNSPLVTLWIGPALGRVERACLRSALRHGHSVTLYCYSEPQGVPEGVTVADAAEILPESRIIRHRSGSVALFSDLFRYHLLARGLGTWIDTDVYVVRPIDQARPHLFGHQSVNVLNGAVLRLPADSLMLAALLDLFEERDVPDWLSAEEREAAAARLLAYGRTGLALMPWGTAGPDAITALAHRFGVYDQALPQQAFYPAHVSQSRWLLDPTNRLEDAVLPDTMAIHLWSNLIRNWKDQPAPAGTVLARLHAEGA
ncbi:hypothetical protein [Sphingosinicella terrae]|uniref:hypothetical protein n=1 Tax=Sphingosinicella terrae TaxID=2172047 RepID=UPI0013B3B973|nr:hypothetical protein [Sphingosinicella terrae]